MRENITKIPANQDEITLYCYMGESLLKIQVVEQALSHSITLKMNPEATQEGADEFLKKHQRYTLGQANKVAIENKLYNFSLQEEINSFLEQRNWFIHNALFVIQNDFIVEKQKEKIFNKIKAISDKAENIKSEIEYDMINFCESKGRDMSKILELLKLQNQGIRIQK